MILAVVLVASAGCTRTHTAGSDAPATSAATASVDLSNVVVRPSDMPGWLQIRAAGRETTIEKGQDKFVSSCMKGDYAGRSAYRGATLGYGKVPNQKQVQTIATEYRSPSTAESIATSPNWAPCSAASVHNQIATSPVFKLVGSVRASMRRVDLTHRVAIMRIYYQLTDGRLQLPFYNDVVLLWHGTVTATLYLDSTREPFTASLEQHLIGVVEGRL